MNLLFVRCDSRLSDDDMISRRFLYYRTLHIIVPVRSRSRLIVARRRRRLWLLNRLLRNVHLSLLASKRFGISKRGGTRHEGVGTRHGGIRKDVLLLHR
jgi:hypothetical protein